MIEFYVSVLVGIVVLSALANMILAPEYAAMEHQREILEHKTAAYAQARKGWKR